MKISLNEEWQQLAGQQEREAEQQKQRDLKEWALWCYALLMVLFVVMTFIGSYIPAV